MKLRAGVTALAAVAALGLPTAAPAARFAVGLAPGVDAATVRSELARRTGKPVTSLAPLPALVVRAPSAQGLALRGVRYVERLSERRLAFTPNDPLLERQWHLAQVRAFDAWTELPPLAGVRVAVIDSGIDLGHPDLAGRVVESRSFVGGGVRDTQGHGTIVAGIVAAEVGNGIGIAGASPYAELMVAKVVTARRTISVEAEARAIRWAVEHGARVINMSLGGLRDPSDPARDTFSRLEADAVAFAVSRGAVVVAAVGNGDEAPAEPWSYASYPAALPHVLGVSAVARDGSSPVYSNRDAVFNDVTAPGEEIVSTFPRALTAVRPSCAEQGYTPCADDEFRSPEGTSFAAPQVAAAAATLLATQPSLEPEQVTALLERSAVDVDASTGCRRCPLGRDRFTGWGRLDVTRALAALGGPLPPADTFEPNDDAGQDAYRVYGRWRTRTIRATADFWDDENDVYGVYLRRGERLDVALAGPAATDPSLVLWRPATVSVDDLGRQDLRLQTSTRPGAREHLGARAPVTGWYFVHVKLGSQGSGAYRLRLTRR